jgi:excisionase family DNA binding protein
MTILDYKQPIRMEKNMSDNDYLTLEEVCKILDKSPTTIKRYARENLLSSEQNGQELSFNKEEVMRYLTFSERLG